MTLSPEERAAAVVRDYFASDLDIVNGAEGEKRTIEALIAKAIREAENAALERAAQHPAMKHAQSTASVHSSTGTAHGTSPEERALELLDALLAAGAIEQLGRADSIPLIAKAIREAVEDYRLKAESYDACESVARNRLAHIKPEVEALLPALCGVDQKTWLQHKEHMPINAVDMLDYAERKIAIREACNEKLEEAALAALKALGGPAHTYASENADIYRAQDHALATAAERIRKLKDTSP